MVWMIKGKLGACLQQIMISGSLFIVAVDQVRPLDSSGLPLLNAWLPLFHGISADTCIKNINNHL